MPQLDSRNGKRPCSGAKGIQWYLEEKVPGRALGRAFCNLLGTQTGRWDKAMDATRMAHGNHLPYHGRRAVQFAHFDLSPDPLDRPTSEEVLEYAKEWAAHFFGDGGEPGALGCFQCAIVAHDDNENGIMHAHVIVNNTDLVTGRRLHIDDRQNEHDLPDFAQDLARERGWRYFDNTPDQRWVKSEERLPRDERRATLPDGSPKTIVERRLSARGEAAWKDELRTKVGIAKNLSQTERDFASACAELGVSVRVKDGDCVFSASIGGQERTCAGRGLGKAYFGPGVEGRRTLAMQMPSADAARLRESVFKALGDARTHSVSRIGAAGVTQRQIAVALATMRKHRITSEATCARALKRCGKRLGSASAEDGRALRREYGRIKKTGELAGRLGLFEALGETATRDGRIRELESLLATGDAGAADELKRLRAERLVDSPSRSSAASGPAPGLLGSGWDGGDERGDGPALAREAGKAR